MIGIAATIACTAAAQMSTTPGVVFRHFPIDDFAQADRIAIGTSDGRVIGFDAVSGAYAWTLEGGGAAVRDICRVQGRVFWIEQGSNTVRTVSPSFKSESVTLADGGLDGAVWALDAWRDKLIAQTDQGIRVIDPRTLSIRPVSDLFPTDVAKALEQGPAKFRWDGKRGLVVSFRHYGVYKTAPEDGGVSDISLVNAWNIESSGRARLLGGFTAPVTAYRDTGGTRVTLKQGDNTIDLPHGHSDLANVTVGAEGVVALMKSRALTIPFAVANWKSAEATPFRVEPNYATDAALAGDSVWFPMGVRWAIGNITDGSCLVLVPRKGEIRQVAADSSGAYVLTDRGAFRLNPDDDASMRRAGLIAYDLADSNDLTEEQRRLRSALAKTPATSIRAVLKAASLAGAVRRLDKPVAVSSLRYGDLVFEGKSARLYVGNGQVASVSQTGGAEPLRITPTCQFARVILPEVSASAMAVSGRGLLPPQTALGLGHPTYTGGPFARSVPGAEFDRPHLPSHFALQASIEAWQGTPYLWAHSEKGIATDCSGFVTGVYREQGIILPRHSQDIGRAPFGYIVTGDLHYGDVLVFPNPKHVGIYIGNGRTAETIGSAVGYGSIRSHPVAVVRRFLK